MYRGDELSKKELKMNKKVRNEYNVNNNDFITRVFVDNESNTHYSITKRLIDLNLVPNDTPKLTKSFNYIEGDIHIKKTHILSKEIIKLTKMIGKSLAKKYNEIYKKLPNIHSKKRQNHYTIEFYQKYGDDVLKTYRDRLNIDYESIRQFLYN